MNSMAHDDSDPCAYNNVAVLGARGNLGPHIVRSLLTTGFKVTIFSRTESSFKPPIGVDFHKLDFTEISLSRGLRGQDAVVATIAKDRETTLAQKMIIDAAVKAGVQRFIPAEFGSNTEDPAVVERIPIFKSKLAILDHLKEVSAANLNFSYTAICNGAFFDWGLESKFLGFDLPSRRATIYSNGSTPINATTLATIGLAVARALLSPSKTANRFLCISELRTKQTEILAVLEAQTGTRWKVEERDAEETRREGLRMLGRGEGAGAGMLILGDLYGEGVGTVGEERLRVDNMILGIKRREVGDVVREVLNR